MSRLWLNIHEAGLILMERMQGTCDYSRLKRHDIHQDEAPQMREGNGDRCHRETERRVHCQSLTSPVLSTGLSSLLKHPFVLCLLESQIKVCLGTDSSMKIYSFILSNVLKVRALSL